MGVGRDSVSPMSRLILHIGLARKEASDDIHTSTAILNLLHFRFSICGLVVWPNTHLQDMPAGGHCVSAHRDLISSLSNGEGCRAYEVE